MDRRDFHKTCKHGVDNKGSEKCICPFWCAVYHRLRQRCKVHVKELATFTADNIAHLCSMPFHPHSNGASERAVRTVTEGLWQINGGNPDEKLVWLVLIYRRTPTKSGKFPSVMLLGYQITSRLDTRFSVTLAGENLENADWTLSPKSKVYVHNYAQGEKFIPGRVKLLTGGLSKLRIMSRLELRHAPCQGSHDTKAVTQCEHWHFCRPLSVWRLTRSSLRPLPTHMLWTRVGANELCGVIEKSFIWLFSLSCPDFMLFISGGCKYVYLAFASIKISTVSSACPVFFTHLTHMPSAHAFHAHKNYIQKHNTCQVTHVGRCVGKRGGGIFLISERAPS